MKFGLIDRIVELERGERIVALKAVTLAEEYLADHFPTFPVLPGVFMLECMVEAASWLVREAGDFATDVILLESARGVTYKSFVAPGNLLRVEIRCLELRADSSRFAGVGYCDAEEVVKGRFSLKHFDPPMPAKNAARHRENMRRRWAVLRRQDEARSVDVVAPTEK